MDAATPDSYPFGTLINSGETVSFEAVPAEGFRFVEWTGDLEGEAATATLVMTCEKAVTAVFVPITYSLTTSVEGGMGGTVRVEPPPSAEGFVAGSSVTLSAEADDGYAFSHWSGASAEGNPVTVVMEADASVVAHFRVASAFSWWWLLAAGVAIALPAYIIASRRAAGRAG